METAKQMSTKKLTCSEKESIAFEQFKSRVQDLLSEEYDDYSLEKWMKARKYDVNKAEQMFRSSVKFKEKMGVKTILQDYNPPEVLQKYLPGGFCGYAKDGSLIRVELYGKLDMKGIMYSVKKSDLEKYKLQQCEWTLQEWRKESNRLGHRVDGLTVIFDMEGVGTRMLWRPGIQMYLHMVKILENNYPEMMRRLLVINAPRIFPLLYKLVRPLISEDMKNKIHVLSGNYKEILKTYIDEDNLLACYGGTLRDPDGNPKCVTKICQGGDVPPQYYLHNIEQLGHMTTVAVPRSDKVLLEYIVEKPGSVLKWEFKTEDYDIGFGVMYKTENGNVPVIPVSRVNSHIAGEEGICTCDKAGLYYICFDNSFSWARRKTVKYFCEVMLTDDHIINSEISDFIENNDSENDTDLS